MSAALSLAPRQQPRMKMVAGIKLADFIEMPEEDFSSFVYEAEQDPLFSKLADPIDSRGPRPASWRNSFSVACG